MVLACSRHIFVRPVLTMDQRTWTACHVEAFAFFGGVPLRLVSDNLKTGVIKPDIGLYVDRYGRRQVFGDRFGVPDDQLRCHRNLPGELLTTN
jgi:transposase